MRATWLPNPDLWRMAPGSECPKLVRMIVEIGRNSSNKYEFDRDLGLFRLDRALYSPVHYPGDYGFIPGTIAEDGDPIDVLAVVEQPSFPGCLIDVRPIAVLDLVDETESDHKIIAVPKDAPRFDQIRSMEDLAPHLRDEIEHFFTLYKELEGKIVKARGWRGLEEAREAIAASRQRFLDTSACRY